MSGVILFGDSVFFGTGASQRSNGCGKILKTITTIPVLIKARNNDSTKEGLARLKSDVLDKEGYAYVIILFGNNDCRLVSINKPLTNLKEYRNNLNIITDQIISGHKKPLISNLQPIDSAGFYRTYPEMRKFIPIDGNPYDWQKKYSDACEELAEVEKIPLINIRGELEKHKDQTLAFDGLHPNDLGHKIIAQIMLDTLNELKI